MTTASLDERYGRTSARGKRRWLIAFIAIGAVIVGTLVWMTLRNSMYSVSVDTLTYDVVDEHRVDVTFQFTSTAGNDVTCALNAPDEDFGVVGYKVVRFHDIASHTMTTTQTIRTDGLATTGTVEGCWIS